MVNKAVCVVDVTDAATGTVIAGVAAGSATNTVVSEIAVGAATGTVVAGGAAGSTDDAVVIAIAVSRAGSVSQILQVVQADAGAGAAVGADSAR